jgi:hypothetical protein
MSLYLKDPQARIDYAIDWSAAYLDGQAVAQSIWTVSPNEAGAISVAASSFDAQHTAVTLTGGLPGCLYRITNRITLTDGQIDERSISLRVEGR